MYDVAENLRRWHAAGTDVASARVTFVTGLGSSSTTLAIGLSAAGEITGGVLDGATNTHLLPPMQQASGGTALMIDLVVTDQQAKDTVLVCGGRARVRVQSVDDIPQGCVGAPASARDDLLADRRQR